MNAAVACLADPSCVKGLQSGFSRLQWKSWHPLNMPFVEKSDVGKLTLSNFSNAFTSEHLLTMSLLDTNIVLVTKTFMMPSPQSLGS